MELLSKIKRPELVISGYVFLVTHDKCHTLQFKPELESDIG